MTITGIFGKSSYYEIPKKKRKCRFFSLNVSALLLRIFFAARNLKLRTTKKKKNIIYKYNIMENFDIERRERYECCNYGC